MKVVYESMMLTREQAVNALFDNSYSHKPEAIDNMINAICSIASFSFLAKHCPEGKFYMGNGFSIELPPIAIYMSMKKQIVNPWITGGETKESVLSILMSSYSSVLVTLHSVISKTYTVENVTIINSMIERAFVPVEMINGDIL